MSQTSKNVSTDITSSPFHLPVDTDRPITSHPGLVDYFSEYTGVWRHGKLPGFTLILHSQDGTGRQYTIDDISGEIPIPPNPFGEEEKLFVGWSYKVGGEIIATPTIIIEKNTSLFANWREREIYTLTFDAMGGKNPPNPMEKVEGIPITLPALTPTYAQNTFIGWSTTPIDQVVEYQPGDEYSTDGDATLFAVWRHDTYKITFYGNGAASGSMPAVSGIYGIYYLPECKFNPPAGKTFAGWAYESTGYPIASRDIFISSNTKLYAIWVTGDFVIAYDTNSAETIIPYQIKKKGVDIQLSPVVPTLKGNTFLGWCVDDSETPHFQPGDWYTFDASVSLVAVWQPNGFLIKYDANGGAGAPETQTKIPGEPITLSDKIPVRPGFLFLGWAIYPTGPAVYQPGDEYSTDKDLTLYAAWKEIKLKVFYNSNGGSGEMAPSTVGVGVFTLPECTFTPPEFSFFYGWSETPDGKYIITKVEMTTSDKTVYAIWVSMSTFTITYDANGGIGAPAPQEKYKGIPISLSTVEPTLEHYVFQGWSKSKTGEVDYKPGALYAEDKSITLYAVWEIEKFTLTFDGNGGSGEDKMPPIELSYGVNAIPGSKFIPPKGKRFAGWAESKTDINLITEIMMDKNKTIYAIWTDQNKFLVTYDLNGAPESEEKLYPPQYKQYLYALPLSDRIPHYSNDKTIDNGWLFLGWADNNGKMYSPEAYYRKEMDTAMTAKWHELIHYPVIFLPNGGDGYMAPLDIQGTIVLPDCEFTPPEDCEFIGWALGPYDDPLPPSIKIGSKVVLYAIYE